MNKKRLIITSTISIILVSILMIGTTYSIFTSSDIDENKNVYTTGNLNITYTLSSDNIKFEDITPMSLEDRYEIKPYRITVTNSGNVPYMFDVILNDTTAGDVINYQYIMTEVGQLDPIALNECTNNVIKEDVIVPANSSVNVDVRIWISDTIQNTEVGKSFYGKLSIDGLAIYNSNDNIDNSILEAITKFYGEDYYYDEATQKYISSQNSEIQFTNTVSTYNYTGSSQTFIADHEGAYKLEAWGAQGGSYSSSLLGGKGAYTSGTVNLQKNQNIYIYVGAQGGSNDSVTNVGGYNGGGYSGNNGSGKSMGGGGATDFRLISGNWNERNSLFSRIMVAAGGGGNVSTSGYTIVVGAGGSLTGVDGGGSYSSNTPTGGTQISGGVGHKLDSDTDYVRNGTFGYAPQSNTDGWGGGGGSGYYAGANGYGKGGAGGSSYISGYKGAISSGNKQYFKFVYLPNNIKAYDNYGNVIMNKTVSVVAKNIERNSNYLGKSNWSSDPYFNGNIYKLKITLTNGKAVLNYDFTKNTVKDLSGNGYDGTLKNGASLQFNGKEYALVLDGVDDYLEVPTLPASIDWANGFTIEFEALWNEIEQMARIFDFGNGTASDNIAISSDLPDNLYFAIRNEPNGEGFNSNSCLQSNGINFGVNKTVCTNNTTDITCSYHYSGLIFNKSKMIAGNESMPTHDGTSTMTGNSGNGYAKITPAIPTITSGSLTVTQGNILDVSSIGCVDKGAGCTIAQIYPRDTRSLEKGTHDIYILVKDDYDTIYKYTKSFTVT